MKQVFSFYSEKGTLVPVWALKSQEGLSYSLMIGTMHGDEPEGCYLIERFLKTDMEVKENWLFIPCFNPDGKQMDIRENANHVDLNRNYPTKNFQATSYNPHSGQSKSGTPASEKETQGMLKLFELFDISKVLSIHSDLAVVDFDGPAKEWAKEIADLTGYPLTESGVGYPTPGSFGNWAGIERNIPVVTLETHKARTDAELNELWLRFIPFFKSLCKTFNSSSDK